MKKNILLLAFCITSFIVSAQKNPCNTDINIDYTKEKSDTTITLQNGTKLTFNRCEFFDVRYCLAFTEIRTVQDLQSNGLTTMDSDGNVLLSCGMFKIDFNKGDCSKECLDVPVRVRIPLFTSKCIGSNRPRRMYKAITNGKWEDLKSEAKIIEIDGIKYSEFYMKCGGGVNCDQRLNTIVVKFKSKNIKKLTNINLSANCPLLNLYFEPGRRKNIIYAKVPCMIADSLTIKVEGKDKDGNYVSLTKKLSECRPKYKVTECAPISRKILRNILGLFKVRERNIYRKYIID
jgi:hypothetical protein